jgi:peptidoglycan/LPS O-acetylase OafA/YrhL
MMHAVLAKQPGNKKITETHDNVHLWGLDLLRFIAAGLVVSFHFGLFERGARAAAHLRGIDQPIVLANWTHFGWVGVQVFFVISGFVIAFSSQKITARRFFLARFARLVPGVWVCAPISLLALQYFHHDAWRQNLAPFFSSIFFDPFGPWIEISYWTLGIEVAFYCAVLLIIICKKSGSLKTLGIVIGTISSLLSSIKFLTDLNIDSPFFLWLNWFVNERISALLLVHHGQFFAIGILLWSLTVEKASSYKLREIAWLAIFVIAGAFQIWTQCSEYNDIYSTAYSPIVACAWWFASLAMIVMSVRFNNIFTRWGNRSKRAVLALGWMVFPLYLVNFNVGRVIFSSLEKHGVSLEPSVFLTCIVLLTLSLAITLFLERPLQKFVRNRFLGKTSLSK